MNWSAVAIYMVIAVVILFIVWRLLKKGIMIALVALVVIFGIGVMTGALKESKTPQQFVDKSLANTKSEMNRQVDKAKEKAKTEVEKRAKDTIESVTKKK